MVRRGHAGDLNREFEAQFRCAALDGYGITERLYRYDAAAAA
jgi:hypothetical protein